MLNGIGVCTRLLPGSPNGVRFMGMNDGLERDLKKKHHEKVQSLAAKEVSDDDYTIRGMMLCNSERDYYYSRFSREALDEIAEMLPGAPVMRGHQHADLALGTFFDAEVVKREGKAERDASAVRALYMIPNDDEGQRLVKRIDLGVQREVSIGWRCAGAECSICGEHIYSCAHIPGDLYKPQDGQRGAGLCEFEFGGILNVLEGSMVFRGGQKDTSTFVPEGADPEAAVVAGAASRLVRMISGDVAWDELSNLKRTAAPDYELMPNRLRGMVAQYARAAGYGLMCATPGERNNTQSVVLGRDKFPDMKAAARWARDHEFAANKRQTTAKSYVFEQFGKERAEAGSFEELNIDEGVTARICKRAQKQEGAQRNGRSLDDWLAGASQK